MFQYNSDGSKIHNSHSYTTEIKCASNQLLCIAESVEVASLHNVDEVFRFKGSCSCPSVVSVFLHFTMVYYCDDTSCLQWTETKR